jgi:hypothetical protein
MNIKTMREDCYFCTFKVPQGANNLILCTFKVPQGANNLILCTFRYYTQTFFVTRLIINKINKVQWVDFDEYKDNEGRLLLINVEINNVI